MDCRRGKRGGELEVWIVEVVNLRGIDVYASDLQRLTAGDADDTLLSVVREPGEVHGAAEDDHEPGAENEFAAPVHPQEVLGEHRHLLLGADGPLEKGIGNPGEFWVRNGDVRDSCVQAGWESWKGFVYGKKNIIFKGMCASK